MKVIEEHCFLGEISLAEKSVVMDGLRWGSCRLGCQIDLQGRSFDGNHFLASIHMAMVTYWPNLSSNSPKAMGSLT